MNLQVVIYIILCTLILLTSVKCCINWPRKLKDVLIQNSQFNKIILIIDKSALSYTDHLGQLASCIMQSYSTILLNTNDRDDLTYEETSTLCLYTVKVEGNTDLRRLRKIIRIGLTSLNIYPNKIRLIIIMFCASKLSNLIVAALKSVYESKYSFKEYYLKIIEIVIDNKLQILNLKIQLSVQMHEFNSYENIYSIKNLSEVDKIFPVVVNNFHGRKLKLLLYPMVPTVDVKLNKTGCPDPRTLAGPEGMVFRTLAETSNFSFDIFIAKQTPLPANLNKKCMMNNYRIKLLLSGRIHVSGNFFVLPILRNWTQKDYVNELDIVHYAHVRRPEAMVALIPILYENEITLPENFLTFFLTTMIIVFIVKGVILLMKFESDFWTISNILHAFFGLGVRDKTKIVSERMILSSVLILSMIYSVTIIDQLFDIQINLNREIKLNTWEELAAANLTFMTTQFYRDTLLETDFPVLHKLAKKAIMPKKGEDIMNNCIDNLVNKFYKNISCLDILSKAEHQVQSSAVKWGQTNIAILKEHLVELWSVIIMSPDTTCAKRFEQIMQYLTEAGLMERWYQTELVISKEQRIKTFINKNSNQKSQNNNVILQSRIIYLLGCLLSVLIFFGELIIFRLRKTACYIYNIVNIKKYDRNLKKISK